MHRQFVVNSFGQSLPRSWANAIDAPRHDTQFHEGCMEWWSGEWNMEYFLSASKCFLFRVKLMHRVRRLVDVLMRVFAGRSCDCALLPRFSLNSLAFFCIFGVYWWIFAYFWSDVLGVLKGSAPPILTFSPPTPTVKYVNAPPRAAKLQSKVALATPLTFLQAHNFLAAAAGIAPRANCLLRFWRRFLPNSHWR